MSFPINAAHVLRSTSRGLSELPHSAVSGAADLPWGPLTQEDTVGYSRGKGACWVLERRKARAVRRRGEEGHTPYQSMPA